MRCLPPVRTGTVGALVGLLLWACWPTLVTMTAKWSHDPQDSHGYLVPAFAAVLLWLRRSQLAGVPLQPNGWAVLFLLAGLLTRLAGTCFYLEWLDAVSLLVWLAGLVVLQGGWPALRRSWPAIAFLMFMIPLPYRIETALAYPLRSVATQLSTYLVQTLGLAALAEGNTILLNHGRIGVAEACSGLSMLLIFFALSTAVAVLSKRPWLDKVVIVGSAAPIAVVANVAGITVTALAQELISPEIAHAIFHDWAGWLMMPLALGLLGLELWLLSRLLVIPAPSAPVGIGPSRPAGMAAPPGATGKRQRKQQPQPVSLPRPGRRRKAGHA